MAFLVLQLMLFLILRLWLVPLEVLLLYGLVSWALQVRQLLLHFLISWGAFGPGKGSQRRLSPQSILCVIFESSNLAWVSCLNLFSFGLLELIF